MHVLKELERLSSEIGSLGDKIDCVDKKVSDLRVVVAHKGALWGAVTGGVMALGGWLLNK